MVKLEFIQPGLAKQVYQRIEFFSISINCIKSKKLELLASLDFNQPQIVAIQDTKIDSSISTSESFPETCPYSVYRKDNKLQGGGRMLLILKYISHMPITELEYNSESVWVKVFTKKTSRFVASWYRPPGSKLEDHMLELRLFRSQLEKIKRTQRIKATNSLSPYSLGL